jgi:hypothetical protein
VKSGFHPNLSRISRVLGFPIPVGFQWIPVGFRWNLVSTRIEAVFLELNSRLGLPNSGGIPVNSGGTKSSFHLNGSHISRVWGFPIPAGFRWDSGEFRWVRMNSKDYGWIRVDSNDFVSFQRVLQIRVNFIINVKKTM